MAAKNAVAGNARTPASSPTARRPAATKTPGTLSRSEKYFRCPTGPASPRLVPTNKRGFPPNVKRNGTARLSLSLRKRSSRFSPPQSWAK